MFSNTSPAAGTPPDPGTGPVVARQNGGAAMQAAAFGCARPVSAAAEAAVTR